MVLETFDQEKYEKAMKQEGYEDGYNDGRTDGYSAGREDGLRQLISALMDIRKNMVCLKERSSLRSHRNTILPRMRLCRK